MKKFLLLALLLISCRSYSQDFKRVYHEGDKTVSTTISRFYSKEIMVNLPAIYRMINQEAKGFSYAKVDEGRIYWFVAVFEADNIYEGQSIKVVLVDSYRMKFHERRLIWISALRFYSFWHREIFSDVRRSAPR